MVTTPVADRGHLVRPGTADHFPRYLARLFRMRSYAWSSARRGLESENATTNLGQLWLLLQPALTICILWFVFDVLLKVSRGSDNYVAFLTIGILVFNHNQRGVLRGSAALVNGAPILLSFSFPRTVLVLSQVLHAAASYRYGLAVGLIVLPFMGEAPSAAWLWMIPISLLQVVFNFGLAALLARPATHFSDFRLALEYIFQILFYVSGIFFPVSTFIGDLSNGDLLVRLVSLNPFFGFVELSRWALMGTAPTHPGTMLASVIGCSLGLLVLGTFVFWRGESELSGVKTIKVAV